MLHQGHFKVKAVFFFFNCECIAVKIGLSTSTTMLVPTRAVVLLTTAFQPSVQMPTQRKR